MLETGRGLDCSLAAQLSPGRQVAGDGHTLLHMVFLVLGIVLASASLYSQGCSLALWRNEQTDIKWVSEMVKASVTCKAYKTATA